MERAKKNFESGAVFQADDEKLIPSLLQYINEQVNTNVKSSQPITAVIYTAMESAFHHLLGIPLRFQSFS